MVLNETEKDQKRIKIIEALQCPGFPEAICEDDVDNLFLVIRPIIKYSFNSKLNFIISKSDVSTNLNLLKRSISEEMEIYIKGKMKSYLFYKKKWKHGVPIIAYLRKCISFFYILDTRFTCNVQKIKAYVCPTCKSFLEKSKLHEGSTGLLYCQSCEQFIKNNIEEYSKDRIELCKKMLPHSKKGVRCPRCERFVPISLMRDGKLVCPFVGCGQKCDISQNMNHPVGFFYQKFEDEAGFHLASLEKNQEKKLSDQQEANEKIKKLKKIIKEQQEVQGHTRLAPNKYVMYDAINQMMDKHPMQTFNYIVRKISNNDLPLQAMIFQEFSKKMLSLFPIMLSSKSGSITVTDPTDSRINLFTGHMRFTETVDEALVLRKPTLLSRYKANCKYSCDICKNPQTCSFIGYVTKITDDDGNDLMGAVDNYGFTNVKFKRGEVEAGRVVTVSYYAIPAHYSVKSMAHMQRIIKRLQKSCANKGL